MLDEQGIRALLPQPRMTSSTVPATTTVDNSMVPDFPAPMQVTTAAPQSLQGATIDGEGRILFNDPMEKITYDAMTGVPGQDEGMGGSGLSPSSSPTSTRPAMVYDLSKDVPEEQGVRWKMWAITIAVLVTVLLCLAALLLRGRGSTSASVSNTGYGGGYGTGGF